MSDDDSIPSHQKVPDEVSVGEGTKGFPDQSKYPPIVAGGLLLLGFGLSFPYVLLPFSSLFVIGAGAVVTLWGVGGWAIDYAVDDYEDNLIPKQKRQLLGMKSGALAMWLFIVSEALLFAGLFLMYFYLNADYGPWPPSGLPPLDRRYALRLTGILVLSGGTMYVARKGLERDNRTMFNAGLGVTITLGIVFLIGQVYEYSSMWSKGLTPWTQAYGSSFYVITGTHMAHVIVGVIFLGIVAARAWFRGHFTPDRQLWVKTASYYWHFVDAVWLLIVVFVYY